MSHVDSFISNSNQKPISKRLLITSTNKLGLNTKEKILRQNDDRPVTTYLRTDFEKAEVDYPDHYKQLKSGKQKEKPKPHDYQRDAISDVVEKFKTADRGQLIMACGTGKTFTTLWIKERMKSKNTLVLLPSLNLLAQTVREWTFASKSMIDVLCVCSDKTVGRRRDEDEVIQSVSDVPFPVQSEVSEIRKFLKGPGDKVIFSTYQSSELVANAQRGRGLEPFDLVVADEAHRCAISGKPDSPFATVLDGKKIKTKKRLFATATPRTYTKAVMTAAEGRGVEVVGMNDEAVFGRQFHTLTFGEAIKRKPPLLTDYQVVIIGVDNEMIAEWIKTRELVTTEKGEVETDAETHAAQIGLLKAIKDYKLKRVISFHSRVTRAQDFAEDINAAVQVVDKRHRPKGTIHADFVSGKMSTSDRGDKLKRLKQKGANKIGLLANARCLSEGVDVPSLDGVAFIDPKNSQVDIIQAVGRAIRLSRNKTVGTIVLPVFIEEGDDAEERIEASNFQPIWWVLNALKAHDKVLVDELNAIRTDMGKRGPSAARSGSISKVVLDLPVTVGKSFANALKTHLVEQTTTSWSFWFGLLETYVAENEDALVTNKHKTSEGFKLGNWVSRQRLNRYFLSPDQQRKLEALTGWVWDAIQHLWEEGYKHLKYYVGQKGTAYVPVTFQTAEGFMLGPWVNSRRLDYKNRRLSADKVNSLEHFPGWVWSPEEHEFQLALTAIEDFYDEFKHYKIEWDYVTTDGFTCGSYISRVQSAYINGNLSAEKISRFEALPNWVWKNKSDIIFSAGLERLREYNSENNHTNVSVRHVDDTGFRLGRWVNYQIRSYKAGKLPDDRISELITFRDWTWDPYGRMFNNGLLKLKDYVSEHHHARVPSNFVDQNGFDLGAWVSHRRREYKMGKLSKERIEVLTKIRGWVWSAYDAGFIDGVEKLTQFAIDNKHTNIEQKYVDEKEFSLGRWVSKRRAEYKKGKLKPARIDLLKNVPHWVW